MIRQERTQRSAISMVSNSPEAIAKKGNWPFIAVQYLLQGILGCLPTTMILTYPTIPNYLIIGLFEAVRIPSTIKFTFAPILQTYTSVFYGKRKMWIMISGTFMGLLILVASFYTGEEHQLLMAILFFISMIFNSCADISIVLPEKISYVQSASKKIGNIIGGFVFLKLVSVKFAGWFGMTHAITTVSTFLRVIGISFIALQVFTHFFYKQEILEQEIEKKDVGICETIKEYRVFFNCKDKYFRTGIFLMSTVFGLLFFSSSYQYELMKNGFSRERVNEIQTISALPIVFLGYYFSALCTKENIYKLIALTVIGRMANFVIAYIFQPQNAFPVITYLFFEEIFHSMSGLLDGFLINCFPVTAVSGMMITMLNSMKNFGHNFTFHLFVVNRIGHRTASLIGFVLHAAYLVFGYRAIVRWVQNGEEDNRVPVVFNESTHREGKDPNKMNEDQRLDDFEVNPPDQVEQAQDKFKKRMSVVDPRVASMGLKPSRSLHNMKFAMNSKGQQYLKKISVIEEQESGKEQEKKPTADVDFDMKSEISHISQKKSVQRKPSNGQIEKKNEEKSPIRQKDESRERKASRNLESPKPNGKEELKGILKPPKEDQKP